MHKIRQLLMPTTAQSVPHSISSSSLHGTNNAVNSGTISASTYPSHTPYPISPILPLQQTIGNQAVMRLINKGGERLATTVQRQIDPPIKAGTKIKIWVNRTESDQEMITSADKIEIALVSLAEDFDEGNDEASYYELSSTASTSQPKRGKTSKKSNSSAKSQTIAAKYAFDEGTKDGMARARLFRLIQDEKKASESTIPEDVIAFLLAEMQEYLEDAGTTGYELDANSIRLAIPRTETLSFTLASSESADEGEKEPMLTAIKAAFQEDGMQELYCQELDSAMQGSGVEEELKQRSGGGGGGSGGGKTKKEWKHQKTIEVRNKLIRELEESNGPRYDEAEIAVLKDLLTATELSHKMAKGHFKELFSKLDKAPSSTPGVSETHQAIAEVENITGIHDREKAMRNWTANLELGFTEDKRSDNPGHGFDGNVRNGSFTPRSERLQELDLAIISDDPDWVTVARLINEIIGEHKQLMGKQNRREQDLSYPLLSQWYKEKEDKKYKRRQNKKEKGD